jgi:hypothetical protein
MTEDFQRFRAAGGGGGLVADIRVNAFVKASKSLRWTS